MKVVDLGRIGYREAEVVQLETLAGVTAGEADDTLFVLEHPEVVTLGRQGGAAHLHVSEAALAKRGVDVVQTTRGGDVTCHFPGQLVAYPVWRIERRPGGLKRFFHDMEEAVMATCAVFGVTTMRRDGHPGVWVDETRKICSMGLGVKRWTAYHGLALNVGRDVSLFDAVTLCGIQGARATSLSLEAGRDITVEAAKDVFIQCFRQAVAHSPVA